MTKDTVSRRRNLGLLTAGVVGLVILAATPACTPADAASFANVIHEVENPTTGSALLTSWQNEVNSAQQWGYTQADERFVGSRTAKPGLTPVYRLYKSSTRDFFVTRSTSERDAAVANDGYVDQGISFYVSPMDTDATEPVARYQKGALHRFALSPSDRAELEAAGWTYEQVAFYAVPTAADAPQFDTTTTTTTTSIPDTTTTTAVTNPLDGDGIFSIAVAPDTQRELYSASTQLFDQRMDWLVEQTDVQDIRFITQTGDLVDWGGAPGKDQYMYIHASEGLEALDDADANYLLTIGNHDTGAVCEGGSACPGGNASVAIRDTTVFNQYFSSERQGIPLAQEFEPGKVDNAYKLFEAEGVQWMTLTLEMNPRAAVVAWAEQAVAAHPDHNVIITSHYLLNSDGTVSTSNSGYGATTPRYVYDNLVLKYANIRMVFSGHVGTAAHRSDVGANGNKVISMVGTLHESNFNPTRLVTIDVNAGTVEARITANNSKNGQAIPSYAQYDVDFAGLDFIGA